MHLQMSHINKSFGANHVLRSVDFSVAPGEIRALLGENGAGKSTLMNILGGVIHADSGEIRLDGKSVHFDTPRASLDAGVAFIHQELNLVTDLMVYENLFIGRELKKGAFLDRAEMCRRSDEVFSRMGIRVDPKATVRDLDASYKQIVEIARALLMNARLIIMDEPTTSLTEVEIARVFEMMRMLRRQGVGIVFISHKLKEVLAVCDTYSVLRDGRLVSSGDVQGVTTEALARDMVGHEVRTLNLQRDRERGEVVLRAEKLSDPKGRFRDVSFSIRAGEVVGFTGLLGDGRSELFQAVFGALPGAEGDLYVREKRVKMHATSQAKALGLGYVPRDRKENGIVRDLSILENGSIVTMEDISRLGFIDGKRQRADFDRQRDALSIKMGDGRDPITSLSGGNQQKVVLAKWLSADPRVLIFDNPTQGVDVGAKEEIYDIILALADAGVGIVVLSSEAQEVIRLCDRALIMYHGAVQGELKGPEMTEQRIMMLATGAT